MHRMNSLFVRVIYSRFMLCQWSFLGAVGSTFSGELFCRMAGVCGHGAGIRGDTLPDSQFPAGQRTLSPATQKAFPGRLPSNCRVVMGGLGRWFFHADIRHSLSEGALSAGVLAGRYFLRGTL